MIVFPVFYHVDPSEVRNQTGSYGTAFQHHEKIFDKKTVEGWRKALRDIGQLKGWDLKNTADGHEGKLVRLIVEKVWSKLDKNRLTISDDVVGMDSHIEKIEKLLSSESKQNNQIVGIHGLGGIGKTTIARFVYNKVYRDFEGCCFLEDVQETIKTRGITHLQSQLVTSILNLKNTDIGSVDEGTSLIKQRSSTKKVFIVLDDVDRYTNLNAIIGEGDWFGIGSKIIITTRDKHVLDNLGVDNIYKPNEMDLDQSLKLFSRHAFKMDHPPEIFFELSRDVIRTSGGLPLALKVIGSYLCCLGELAWIDAVKKLANTPHQKVQEKLRISYDGLDHEEKKMFLDIACFFIGRKKDIICHIWDGTNFAPHLGIENLCLKSLIEINEKNEFRMHDQLRDLGREIVRQENYEVLGERSRLWSLEDVKEILSTQQGTSKVEGLCLNLPFSKSIIEGFGAMTGLRVLEVNDARVTRNLKHSCANLRYLSWTYCPMKFVPINPRRLCVLDFSCTKITHNWIGWKYIKEAETLKVLKLEYCDKLSRTPNLSANKQLEELHLRDCENLVEVDESIGHLKSLVTLDLEFCERLKYIPKSICELTSLRILNLKSTRIRQLPERLVQLEALKELGFDFSEIQLPYLPNLQILTTGWDGFDVNPSVMTTDTIPLPELPSSLRHLNASRCRMKSLPPSLPTLTNLEKLELNNCPNLVEIPTAINALTSLKSFKLEGNCNLREILGFSGMRSLEAIQIRYCPKLAKVESLEGLDSLKWFTLGNCSSFTKFPKFQCLIKMHIIVSRNYIQLSGIVGLENFDSLRHLYPFECPSLAYSSDILLSESLEALLDLTPLSLENLRILCFHLVCVQVIEIPVVGRLESLEELYVSGCNSIEIFPNISYLTKLKMLDVFYCEKLTRIQGLDRLENLEYLNISRCISIETLPGLSNLKKLERLSVIECKKLVDIQGLDGLENLKFLVIHRCISIETLPCLSNLKKLKQLNVLGCEKLVGIQGLDGLENLEGLDFDRCISIETLPCLSNLKKLSLLSIKGCKKLVDIQGLDGLENLETLVISGCISIETLPCLSNLKQLNWLSVYGCEKLVEIQGLDGLENLEYLYIDRCISIKTLPCLSNLKKLKRISVSGCEKLVEIQGLENSACILDRGPKYNRMTGCKNYHCSCRIM